MVLLKRLYNELVTTISSEKKILKKFEDVDKKTPDITKCIATRNFNRLIKTNFNRVVTEMSKGFASKNQVETRLDLGDQNRDEMKKLKTLNYFIGKSYFDNDGLQNYSIF